MKHWLTIHTHLHSWIVHVVSILYIGHHLGCWCYSSKLFISMPSDILKCFPQVCPQTQTIRKQSVTILAFLSQWSLKSQGWPSPFFWNHHKESVFFINLFAGSSPQKKTWRKESFMILHLPSFLLHHSGLLPFTVHWGWLSRSLDQIWGTVTEQTCIACIANASQIPMRHMNHQLPQDRAPGEP